MKLLQLLAQLGELMARAHRARPQGARVRVRRRQPASKAASSTREPTARSTRGAGARARDHRGRRHGARDRPSRWRSSSTSRSATPRRRCCRASRLRRARARMLAEIVNSGIQPLQNLAMTQRVKGELGADDKAWARALDRPGARRRSQALVAGDGGRVLRRRRADVRGLCLVPQLYAARRFGVDLAAYRDARAHRGGVRGAARLPGGPPGPAARRGAGRATASGAVAVRKH